LCFIRKIRRQSQFYSCWVRLGLKNLILIKKIRSRSFNDVAFIKFDPNLNFVLDDILPDVVARLRNYEKYSPCWIDFVRYEIAHSLMEQ